MRACLLVGAALFFVLSACGSPSPDEILRKDARLHEAADRALDGRPGAVVVMDVTNGRIRAMAGEEVAVRWAFSPGSLVKLVTVWKGVEEGVLSPGTRFTCAGSAFFSGTGHRCWYPPGHGDLDLVHALAYSCNLFFLSLGDMIDPDMTYRGLAELGFGRVTGINLPMEWPGRLSGPPEGLSREYLIGDTDAVTATPLQVITYLSALVNGGTVWIPAVTKTVEEIEDFSPRIKKKIDISRAAPIISAGMRGAVLYGTAEKAALEGYEVMGKTGTGENPGVPWETHAWFLGFVPADSPQIAVVVLLERGMGGDDAAPVAREVFRAWFADEQEP